jgi:hypothetical protein
MFFCTSGNVKPESARDKVTVLEFDRTMTTLWKRPSSVNILSLSRIVGAILSNGDLNVDERIDLINCER